ncbi:MAG TPA: SCP2 sterol-binding domain-containing protein [Alcaligenes sp.]|nr:SCP2 sterol-binding domain-containing protein [Alcaligenes sp.]HRL27875.1 SCP2 sterol-binding domain-containing protein [Alcaligenes sp.]
MDMPGISSFLDPAAVGVRLLNALLRREDWARERLRAYAGKTVALALGRLRLVYTITSEGGLDLGHPAVVPDVTLTLPAERLPDLPQVIQDGDFSRIAQLMHVQGEAGLANLVSELAAHLRWDAEEDLSKVVGDVMAVRLVGGARQALAGLRDLGRRLAGNTTEYLSQESGLLVSRDELARLREQTESLSSRLDGLERRLDAGQARVKGR